MSYFNRINTGASGELSSNSVKASQVGEPNSSKFNPHAQVVPSSNHSSVGRVIAGHTSSQSTTVSRPGIQRLYDTLERQELAGRLISAVQLASVLAA